MKLMLALFASLALFCGAAATQDPPAKEAPAKEAPAKEAPGAKGAETVVSKAYYPTAMCVVLDKKLPATPQTVEANGRTLLVCCKRCIGAVNKDPAPWIAKVDKLIVETQKASYPLDTCPVSGKKLGAMGEPHDVVVNGRLVRLCCDGCEKDLADQETQAKVLAKIDAALIAKSGNGAATCCVSHAKVEAGKGVNVIYGMQVVRLCSKGCLAKFESEPRKYLAAEAPAAAPGGAEVKGK